MYLVYGRKWSKGYYTKNRNFQTGACTSTLNILHSSIIPVFVHSSIYSLNDLHFNVSSGKAQMIRLSNKFSYIKVKEPLHNAELCY